MPVSVPPAAPRRRSPQQSQQLTGLADDRFSAQQGGLQKGLAFGDGHREPVGRGCGGFSFLFQQSLLMSGVGDHLVSVVAAAVASHFFGSVENAHQGVGSGPASAAGPLQRGESSSH